MIDFFDIPDGTDKIEVRKKLNTMLSEARRKAKPQKCVLCGQYKTSFCNSHSVPQMFLKEIANNGMLLHASAVMGFDFEILDIENGVNKSGTFNYICRECDSTFFQDYENQDNIVVMPTDKMLAEIAVKNILLQINKRAIETQLIDIQQRKYGAFENPQDIIDIKNLDMREYESELMFHKAIADKNETGGYQILFWDELPYRVPIATQSAIAMPKDMCGNRINNIYDFSETTRMQYMHLAIFPLNKKSIVLAFYHKRDKLYRNLRHQINSLPKEKVLKYLNYVVFAYTENYYISTTIRHEIEKNENLQMLSMESDGLPGLGLLGTNNMFGIDYKPISADSIPNFLSSEWAI